MWVFLIILKLSKVFTSIYGVKNFSKGVKNFWNRPPFLPKSLCPLEFQYDFDIETFVIILKSPLDEIESLVFYPTSKVFYPIYTFCKIFFNVTNNDGFRQEKIRKTFWIQSVFPKLKEKCWMSHHEGFWSQENSFSIFQNWVCRRDWKMGVDEMSHEVW